VEGFIGATLATVALLPLLGVPFLGDRGALYRALGVLTAGVVVTVLQLVQIRLLCVRFWTNWVRLTTLWAC
jgi:hypothetical protein